MHKVLVQIIGAPIACADGVKGTWRDVAHWAEGQLKARFGDEVEMKYYDLFDADCPSIPADAQLPLVLVNGEMLISGGKIAVPVMCRKIESELTLEKH